MKVEIAKWGNSAAVRIPAGALADAGLHIGQSLNLRLESGRLVLEPEAETLDDLVSRITPENRHGLIFEDDAARGVELW